MKTSAHIVLFFIVLSFLFSGCEKEIDFDGPKSEKGLSVFAVAVAGQPFKLRVSRSFTISTHPDFEIGKKSYIGLMDSMFRETALITDARVTVTVNGSVNYEMKFNNVQSDYSYVCEYIPKEGDRIDIKVSADGYKTVTSVTSVEEEPKLEILSTEVVYRENGANNEGLPDYEYDPRVYFGDDSVMIITMRISDPGELKNYYRLMVRGIAKCNHAWGGMVVQPPGYTMSDVFDSDDVLFYDIRLSKPFGQWKAGVSNVFDDKLIDGKDYVFTVESRRRWEEDAHVVVELQAISRDMYYFLKSYQLYRISATEIYTNPISLYCNIENGWGIFGSLIGKRYILYY